MAQSAHKSQVARPLTTIVVSPSNKVKEEVGDPAEATITAIPQTVMVTTELNVEPATQLSGILSIIDSVTTTMSLSTLIRQTTTQTVDSTVMATSLIMAFSTTTGDANQSTTGIATFGETLTTAYPQITSDVVTSEDAKSYNNSTTLNKTLQFSTLLTSTNLNSSRTQALGSPTATPPSITSTVSVVQATATANSAGNHNTVNLGLGLGLGLGIPLLLALFIGLIFIVRAYRSGAEGEPEEKPEIDGEASRQSTKSVAEVHAIIELYSRPVFEAGHPETRHELRASALTRTISYISTVWSQRTSRKILDESSIEGCEHGWF